MKTAFAFMALALVLASSVSCVTTHEPEHRPPSDRLSSLHTEGPRKRILILPFLNDSIEKDAQTALAARDTLIAGLKQTDNYIILDNQDVPKDLTTFQKDQKYDLPAVAKYASDLGALAIIEGKVVQIRGRQSGDSVGLIRAVKSKVDVTVALRVYATAQHREILSETRSGMSQTESSRLGEGDGPPSSLDPVLVHEALTAASQGLILPVVKALDKLGWAGRVALVQGERIYLNAGKITGINIGDILRVSDQGEDIYDPATGVLIGQASGRVKGTLEVISFFGRDGCITIVHSGANFKENDHVELY